MSSTRDDPERADAVVFGRRTDVSRRGFLGGAGLAAMSAAVGGPIVFAATMPGGLIPAAFAQEAKKDAPARRSHLQGPQKLEFPGKDTGLVVLGDKPLVAETPEHLLDDDTTPTSKFFIRNNGQIAEEAARSPMPGSSPSTARSNKPLEITLGDLKKRFASPRPTAWCWNAAATAARSSRRRRAATSGPTAAPGCAEWTGVPLADVLRAAGVKPSAVYTANYGTDVHLSGDPKRSDAVARRADPQGDGAAQPARVGA